MGRPRDRALDQHDILLGIDLDHHQVRSGAPHMPHVLGHPLALVHAARGEAAADGTAVTEELVRPVAVHRACHLVHLHNALVALALGDAHDVNNIARLEDLFSLQNLAHLELGGCVVRLQANLAQNRGSPLDLQLLEELGLGKTQVAWRALLESELQSHIPVLFRRPLRRDHAGPDLERRASQRCSIIVEHAGHP